MYLCVHVCQSCTCTVQATAFVRSTRELFQLMYKMMKAKKRMSGQLEGSPLPSSPSQEGLYTHIEGIAVC